MSEAPDDLSGTPQIGPGLIRAAAFVLAATALMSGVSFALVYLLVM